MAKARTKAKSKVRVKKAFDMNNFLFDNVRIMMFLLILIIVLLLINFSNTQTIVENTIAGELKGGVTAACQDSDGLSFSIFGYVDYKGSRYYDDCLSSNVLEEGICNRNKYDTVTYSCPYGCSGGKCSSAATTTSSSTTTVPTTTTVPVCTDNDDGKNYYAKGTCTDGAGISRTDICLCDMDMYNYSCAVDQSFWNKLNEYSCDPLSSGGLSCRNDIYDCPYGCSNGACIYCPCSDADLNDDNVVNYLDLAICGAMNVTGDCDVCIGYWYGKNCNTTSSSVCWSGSNTYILRDSNQYNKFCKCAQGTYGNQGNSYISGTYTAYQYVNTDDNSIWTVSSITASYPVNYVQCMDGVWYRTNNTYYSSTGTTTTSTTTTTMSTTTTIPAICPTSSSSCSSPDGYIYCGGSLSSCLNAGDWKYYSVPNSAYRNLSIMLTYIGSDCNINDLYIYNSTCSVIYLSGDSYWTKTWSGVPTSDIKIGIDGDSTNPNCYWNMTVIC